MEIHYKKDLELLNKDTEGVDNVDFDVDRKLAEADDHYTDEELLLKSLEIVDND